MSPFRRLVPIATLCALALAVSACGRRGEPEFVSESAGATAGPAGAPVAAAPSRTEPVKPKQPFFLDALL
jgi:hypothetical protein